VSDDIVLPTSSYGTGPTAEGDFELDAGNVAAVFGVDAVKPLGRGAFGETWRLDLADGSYRAAKVIMSPTYSRARLDREVEGLRRVDSPHVVKLVDTASVDVGGATRAALVFEFVPGGDAATRLTPGSQVDSCEVVRFGSGVMAGLAALHAVDTVHRDIKPANIAVRDGDGAQPVLLDLGLARVLDRESITSYPTLIGTAPFMAPEQLRQERARKAADIFAVGVVLHLMAAGAHPFYEGRDTVTFTEAIALINAGPAPLPEHVPADLAFLVRRFLHPDEAERGSARRACRDLARLRDVRPDHAGADPAATATHRDHQGDDHER
jgi:serine/threonine protein kinase